VTKIRFTYFIILLCAGFGCRDLYEPGIVSTDDSYLVVEGVLNAGSGPTDIRISRTFKLDDSARLRGEQNASVTVEGKDNTTRQLTMVSEGIYSSPNLNLELNQEYRLRIVTANGKEYLSEYVVARKTPVIDRVSFRQNDKGVQIYVTTHDNTNNTRYYLWNYEETWEIWTYYFSKYKYENDMVDRRTSADDVSTCWKYENSTDILIGTSAPYEADTIPEAPLNFIGNGDERLAVRYSILVRQYALDKEGYEFYEMMKKNTESLGTIFDAQPSQIKGNIYSASDPTELVIGNISATTVEEKRIFIERTDVDQWQFTQFCPNVRITNDADSIRSAYASGSAIYEAVFDGPFIVAYLFSNASCVDCTKRGGSLIRPAYW
jgi:hypothetical protein